MEGYYLTLDDAVQAAIAQGYRVGMTVGDRVEAVGWRPEDEHRILVTNCRTFYRFSQGWTLDRFNRGRTPKAILCEYDAEFRRTEAELSIARARATIALQDYRCTAKPLFPRAEETATTG